MNLWHRWFNVSPGPGWQFVMDKKGRKYWFHWDHENFNAMFWHYNRFVGQIYLLWRLPELEVADIVIFDPKRRGLGLGTAMMQAIVTLARQQGVERIIGRIVARDGSTPEFLFGWYRRQGFLVDEQRSILRMDMPCNDQNR